MTCHVLRFSKRTLSAALVHTSAGVCFYQRESLPGYSAIFKHPNEELNFCYYLIPCGSGEGQCGGVKVWLRTVSLPHYRVFAIVTCRYSVGVIFRPIDSDSCTSVCGYAKAAATLNGQSPSKLCAKMRHECLCPHTTAELTGQGIWPLAAMVHTSLQLANAQTAPCIEILR